MTMMKKTTPIATANSHTAPLPPPSSASIAHDFVDLTEEDDDNNNVNKVSTQKISPLKPVRILFFRLLSSFYNSPF